MRMIKNQRGQVMPYVAVIVLLITACSFFVFDIGRIVNARIQSQNAADAAALAGVAVKINKHHVDAIMRGAMAQEALISQLKIRASQTVVIQAIFKEKSNPIVIDPRDPNNGSQPINTPLLKDLGDKYRLYADTAYKHAVKMHRENLALQGYYRWLMQRGPTAVREAARVGYLSNIQGYDDLSKAPLRKNVMDVLNEDRDLIENEAGFDEQQVGGIPYKDNGATLEGMFGKTFVELETQMAPGEAGAILLDYLDRFKAINTNAAAGLQQRGKTRTGPSSKLSIDWYSPYLMRIQSTPQEVAH